MEYEWIGELQCDHCGAQGAYDMEGDYVCDVCILTLDAEPEEDEDE